MRVLDFVTDEVPSLKLEDRAEKALHWMEEFKVKHLPVVNDGRYLGVISEDAILDSEEEDCTIENLQSNFQDISVVSNSNPLLVFNKMHSNHLSVLPVLDETNTYIGLLTLDSILEVIAHLTSSNQGGGVIVLEVGIRDYSMSQISQIVEQNNAKILSSFINAVPESNQLQITLKVSRSDLRSIIRNFERYDYSVSAVSSEGKHFDALKERYDELIHYLNI